MRPVRLSVVTAATAVAALTAITGCADKTDASSGGAKGGGGSVHVTAKDDSCAVSKTTFPAGHVQLAVENQGSRVTEVELLFPDGRIVTERENLGPSTNATVTAEVKAGTYSIACIPGMKGEGIRKKVTVTGGAPARRDPVMDAAVDAYRQYAQAQADATLPKVKVFTDAVRAGDIPAAQKAFAPSRVGWERTEPVAESFGDIDPKTDTRADGLEPGQKWTGWHALEKQLWQDRKLGSNATALANELDADLADWQQRVGKAEITPTSMANGAKELLDEVATGKITGEEDRYSHTDLSDFQANVDGAQKAYELLKPIAKKNDAPLTTELDKQFTAIDTLLAKYHDKARSGGFVSYTKVTAPRRKELSDGVNALAEPLSKLAAAVVK